MHPSIPELLRKAVKGLQNWPFFKKLEKSAKFLKGELNPGLLCGSQVYVVDTTHKITKIDLPNMAQIKLF